MHYKIIFQIIIIALISTESNSQTRSETIGGAHKYTQSQQCISHETRQRVRKDILNYESSRHFTTQEFNPKAVNFQWPLRMLPNQLFSNYYGTSNFVDQNPSATGTQFGASNLDYNCGNRSYDTTSGYNHSGIDYFLWPFKWYMFSNNIVEVIAAESGIIVSKSNGYPDQNCSCISSPSNSIHIRHSDGSEAWYWHLKNNSLTSKLVGESISVGEYIGVVGSSGCSTDPHLHFEVYDDQDNIIDPYQGNCNSLNQQSWWANQRDYYEPSINAVLTHDNPPELGCPAINEIPNFRNCFNPGELVYTAFYYTDQRTGMTSQMRIRRPDNSIWYNWDHTSPDYYPTGSYWYWYHTLPANGPYGTWSVEVNFDNKLVSYPFYFGMNDCSCPLEYSTTNGNKLAGTQNTDATFESFGQIQSSQVITDNADLAYDSATFIQLESGFEILSGASLHIFINGCGGI